MSRQRAAPRRALLRLLLLLSCALPVVLGELIAAAPAFYPRAIALANGSSLAAVETPLPGIRVLTLLARAAAAPGAPWAAVATIASDANASAAPDLANPMLLQLPAAGGGGGGALLCAYRHHTGAAGEPRVYRIALARSNDGGASWAPLAVPVVGSTGVWEPFLFLAPAAAAAAATSAQPQPGAAPRLGLAYAAELTNGGEQEIAFRWSSDGGSTWGGVASRIYTAGSRNGMPGVAALPDGSLVAIFEGFWSGTWGAYTVNAATSLDGGASWLRRQVAYAPPPPAPPAPHRDAGSPQIALCPGAAADAAIACAVFMSNVPAAAPAPAWPAGASIVELCAPWTPAAGLNFSAPGARLAVVPTDTPSAYWPALLLDERGSMLRATYQTPRGDAAITAGGLAGCRGARRG